jgi:23S rRNA pseudouridine2605 synthase
MRIQKFLAQHGVGSRRQIERFITEQRIEVNGIIATLGCKVSVADEIKINGKLIKVHDIERQRKTIILLYHKPLGEICSRKDPENRSTVFDNLPKLVDERWIAIGRLDINTSGLLLFTNNGEIANKLMHPRTNIQRKYAVRVFGTATPVILKNLESGVELEDGMAKFDIIEDIGGKGVNHWYHVTLHEGRNREVRRLWQSQGIQVNRIIRIQFGPVYLPDDLKIGCFRELTEKEIVKLLV